MTTDPETTRIVRAWLHADQHESAERILGSVLDRLDATPQRRSVWRSWRRYFVNGTLKFAAVAVPVLLAAGIALGVLVSRPSGPATSPSVSNPTATQLVVAPPTSVATRPPQPATSPVSALPTSSASADVPMWRTTGSMQEFSEGNAVRLEDGTVLAVGGFRAELYDPKSGTWTATGGATTGTTATLLADGRVLVTGGVGRDATVSKRFRPSAEIYDPRSRTWTPTGSMVEQRRNYTATLLADGDVLVAGGMGPDGSYDYLSSAELYDPATGVWSATGAMNVARGTNANGTAPGQSATLLRNGTVLVAGGRATWSEDTASAELYNPSRGQWTMTGNMSAPRNRHTATMLYDGTVLVIGGSTAELYDPVSGTWSIASDLVPPRTGHTATLLPNGDILVVGGETINGPLAFAELYDPRSGIWANAGLLRSPRNWFSATLLPDGSVLVAGGERLQDTTDNAWVPDTSAELFALEPAQ